METEHMEIPKIKKENDRKKLHNPTQTFPEAKGFSLFFHTQQVSASGKAELSLKSFACQLLVNSP